MAYSEGRRTLPTLKVYDFRLQFLFRKSRVDSCLVFEQWEGWLLSSFIGIRIFFSAYSRPLTNHPYFWVGSDAKRSQEEEGDGSLSSVQRII